VLDIAAQLSDHGVKPLGVVHVGAHEGTEVALYKKIGFKQILLIEANPILFEKLSSRYKSDDVVTVAHAAISDQNGLVRLRITSNDQSSSILPLGRHKIYYPEISEVGFVDVPARTLDHLFIELSIEPEKFNFLNIDIQGAELLALSGAVNVLRGIEAINTEINLEELYEGCVLLPELETFLRYQGFNRAAMVRPYHDSWGDAFYVRKQVVGMSTLGSNGRLGNQLFQYLFLRVLAKNQEMLVHTPRWLGTDLFGLQDPVSYVDPPRVDEHRANLETGAQTGAVVSAQSLIVAHKSPFPSMNLHGYFQLHTSFYKKYREEIRKIFTFAEPWRGALNNVVSRLREFSGRKILAIHLRRGDYGDDIFYRAPCQWYIDWIKSAGITPAQFAIYLSSEDPIPYVTRFEEFQVFCSKSLGLPDDPNIAALVDFVALANADLVAISNSSFSFFATMLNETASSFFRPDIALRSIVPYDPWDSQVVEQKELSAEEHYTLSLQD